MAIKEFFFEGKTLDAAIETAALQLGEDKDMLAYELVQAPSKGIFGIGATPAKIKIEKEVPDEVKPVETKPVMPAGFEPEKISKKQKPAKQEKQEKAPKAPKAPKAEPVTFERKLSPVEEGDENVAKITDFILGLLEKLEITDGSVKISIDDESGDYFAEVAGSKMGVLIGRRGETLDAVQYITNLVVCRGKDKKVIIDSENYRAKRINTIVALANKTADKAIKYRKNQSLEPMSAYERRIIHTALAEREGISTFSVGTEPHRKIVISYKG